MKRGSDIALHKQVFGEDDESSVFSAGASHEDRTLGERWGRSTRRLYFVRCEAKGAIRGQDEHADPAPHAEGRP
jgi:hypothetical protein